jgi:hypothetical protein
VRLVCLDGILSYDTRGSVKNSGEPHVVAAQIRRDCYRFRMGGLAFASILAKLRKWRVLVLERHFKIGGFTHRLVDTVTTPMLLKVVRSGQLLVTHRFPINDIMKAYDTFGNAAKEGALKVVLTNVAPR